MIISRLSARPASRGAGDRPTLPRHPLFFLALVAITAVAVYLQLTYVPLHARVFGLFQNQLDLKVYRAGALHLLHDRAIYNGPVYRRMEYTYPPFSTIVLQPLAWVSKSTAIFVWGGLTIAALLFVVIRCFLALGYRLDAPLVALSVTVAAVALLFEPVRTTIWYGQVNVFLMAVIVWDLLRPNGAGRWGRLRGFSVGVTAGIKLTPGFFLLYLALTRQWRAVVTAVAVLAATVAAGFAIIPRASWSFFTDRVFDSGRVGFARNPANQSLRGALATIVDTDHPSPVLWMLCAIAAVALGLSAAWVAHRLGNEVLALALVGMTATAISPFSWGHHWVWFVPLMVVAVDLVLRAWARGDWRRGTLLLSAPIALVLSVFMWTDRIPEGALGFRPYYGVGAFMNPAPSWVRVFSAQPYLWVFAVAAVITIVVGLRLRRPDHRTDSPAPAGDSLGPGSAVGGRR
ncbi:glycosyltransferase 87 family protein [Williamsia sp. CHRR-6]|uniref:glycosyltransferase 87 family protein n=1 Tax=Williamsia sp. CHRR-6 TaxID=2835871 RepID=UPI001BDA03D5|nr:glycosyltransferase 87 family protein [Williamsia sp. CHRR-6]MBT0567230.1 DUF2029 domain-containing protein [Williamsia sp. CHRR-6]